MPTCKFTTEIIRYMARYYKEMNVTDLSRAVNEEFAVETTPATIKAALQRYRIRCGRDGKFVKGQKSWNKGKKGVCYSPATVFKKGSVPANRKPLGHERIDKDGFVWIKVARTDKWTGRKTTYMHKHRHVWEEHNGPVPAGKVVCFRDGNKQNCAIENLYLLTRDELLCLNRKGMHGYPAEIKDSVVAMVKLERKMHKRAKEL